MQNPELDGLRKLRSGILFLIISPFLAGIGFLMLSLFGLAALAGASSGGAVGAAAGFITDIIAGGILILLGSILGIVGVLRIKGGFDILKSIGRDVGIGGTGGTLYLVGLIITVIGALIVITVVGIPVGLPLYYLGLVIALIGDILIGVGIYKVGDAYNEGTTKIGGILAAIPFDLISFIGYIISYIGIGKIINMVSSGTYVANPSYQAGYSQPYSQYPQQYPSQAPQFYQVGQGIIRSNGYAQLAIYASTPASIISANIQGTPLTSSNINPNMLNQGNNYLNIFFGNTSSLQIGGQYTITITINSGGNIITINAIATYQG
ncbi:DUF973 family protein [Acidianus manzaensis]|nr:DUF973 family protein [Acidianus manzaensis]